MRPADISLSIFCARAEFFAMSMSPEVGRSRRLAATYKTGEHMAYTVLLMTTYDKAWVYCAPFSKHAQWCCVGNVRLDELACLQAYRPQTNLGPHTQS